MRKQLLISSLLLSVTAISSSSSAQVDGKGIICTRTEPGHETTGFYFENGTVVQVQFRREKDEYFLSTYVFDDYSATANSISWSNDTSAAVPVWFEFSRKDGTLVEFFKPTRPSDPGLEFICEVMESMEIYLDRMESILESKQAEYDEQREGNVL